MQVLGAQPRVVAAVVHFVEIRCLLGGTATSQGVALASSPGLVTHFRGLVRNVESALANLTVAEAEDALGATLSALPDHDQHILARIPEHQIRLAVEGLVDNQMSPRHHLTLFGAPTGPDLPGTRAAAGAPAPINLPTLTLQPLTAAGRSGFGQSLGSEINLPAAVRDGLTALYGT
jgi:hypothetical protein